MLQNGYIMDLSMDKPDQKKNVETFFHKVYVLNSFLAVLDLHFVLIFYSPFII